MNAFENVPSIFDLMGIAQKPETAKDFDEADWKDGYFPSHTTSFGVGCIEGADEWGRYPYGMDFYTWNEPKYHWINSKWIADYYSQNLTFVLMSWIEKDMSVPPEEMVNIYEMITNHSVIDLPREF